MAKKKTQLQQAEEKICEAISSLNSNIEHLGITAGNMYKQLNEIRQNFDRIRGVPSEMALQYEETKQITSSWKSKVDEVENEYNEFLVKNIGGGVAGGALGLGVAAAGPAVAMGVATTFGVASTGTAISALSGAAATNAALAWLGGGALAAGGGGMAAGNFLLACASPVGLGVCLVSLATGGILFYLGRKKRKRLEEIFLLVAKRDLKTYKLADTEVKERELTLNNETIQLAIANHEIASFGTDYQAMTEEQQYKLGIYVNLMLAAAQNLVKPVYALIPKFTDDDKSLVKTSLTKEQMEQVVSLANFLYAVDLDENDINILHSSFKKNKEYLKSSKLKKDEFIKEIFICAKKMETAKYGANHLISK